MRISSPILLAVLLFGCAAPPTPSFRPDDWQDRSYRDRSGEPRRGGSAPRASRRPRNEVSLLIGGRQLEDDTFWDPNDGQFAWGIETVIGIVHGFGIEFGLLSGYSFDEVANVDFTHVNVEGSFGLRYAHDFGRVVPYVGAGLAGLLVYQEIGSSDFDDETLAGYVHGGVEFEITDHFAAGLDFRRLFGSEIELSGFVPTDVDYGQLALRLSFIF